MLDQMEELRRKERELGDINKHLKYKLEAEGQNCFRALQSSWESNSLMAGSSTYHGQSSHSNPVNCEPTLHIGYHHFLPSETSIPRSTNGEVSFIHGWALESIL